MNVLTAAMLFLSAFGAALAAGGLLLVLVAVVPARSRLPTQEAIRFHQESTWRIDRYVPPSVAVAMLAAIGSLVLGTGSAAATAATAIGLVGMATVTVVSVGFNMPLNRRIAGWSAAAPPTGHATAFTRWRRSHVVRTIAGLVGMTAFIVAAVAG